MKIPQRLFNYDSPPDPEEKEPTGIGSDVYLEDADVKYEERRDG